MFPEPEIVPTTSTQPKPKKSTARLSVSKSNTVDIYGNTEQKRAPKLKNASVLGVATADSAEPLDPTKVKKELPFGDDDEYDSGQKRRRDSDDGDFFDDMDMYEPLVKEEIPDTDSDYVPKKRRKGRAKRGEAVEKKPRKKIGRPKGSGWNQKLGSKTEKAKKSLPKKKPKTKKVKTGEDGEGEGEKKVKAEAGDGFSDDEFGDKPKDGEKKKKRK